MAETLHVKFHLPDRSYQAVVRSEIRKMAESAGFTDHRLGEVEIIVAEITSNLIKHTDKGGILLVRILDDTQGLEIISIDNGPGMKLPQKMMEDGHSTKKTLGHGLGAIRRLSNVFDFYTMPGWGTVLLSRIYIDKNFIHGNKNSFQLDVLEVAKDGEKVCGDSWRYVNTGKKIRLTLIDGLGHGASAHAAAQEASRAFGLYPKPTPMEQVKSLHENLKKTRGAVITVVYLDQINHQVSYSGVGNISMKILSSFRARSCFSYNGIVGHIMPASLANHALQWNDKTDIIIMHTDGITSRWDIQKYPAILQHHSMLLCAALFKDFNRGNDDSTILIGRFVK